jgi:ADP-ribosylation factor 1/2
LRLGSVTTTIPTIEFNVETVTYKNLTFTSFTLGDPDKLRPLFKRCHHNVRGIVFVVDSTDRARIDGAAGSESSAKDEPHWLLSENSLKDAVVLVAANKQDRPTP